MQGKAGKGRVGWISQGGRGAAQGKAESTGQDKAGQSSRNRAGQGYLLLGCSQLRLGRCLSLSRLLALSWVSFKQLHVRQLFSSFFSHHFQHLCPSKVEFNLDGQEGKKTTSSLLTSSCPGLP